MDYIYAETEVIDPNYTHDSRVYDANRFIVKELIKIVDESNSHVRRQHFMQADSHAGSTTFMIRHHGEIWHKNPSYRYKYLGRFDENDRCSIETIDNSKPIWVKEILSLDEGPRYQCLSQWKENQTLFFMVTYE
ncbi:hypothetical protein KCG35_21540 [Zooshikella sp. WH53]|uniref:Uncharacterized protein n=1 Tax=Zooshikella harenae TaxID=2827238 RepID=A0ABS5ZHV0_9GAMM|nr:hypothetical protein [Zooshikella harenae]